MDDEDHRSIELVEIDDEGESEEEVIEFEVEDDEDFQELEKLKPLVAETWTDEDGTTIHGVKVINDDLTDSKNRRCQLDICPICYLSWTSRGNHRLCCLPCGHMYGLSCIKKWLLQSSSSRGKCPQCNTVCSYKDVILLYASHLCISPHQRETSSARHFPFTKQGLFEFKYNELCRRRDAQKLYPDAADRVSRMFQQLQNAEDQQFELMSQWNDVKKQLNELEQQAEILGESDASQQQAKSLERLAGTLKRRADALKRWIDASEPRADTLERHADALGERITEYTSRVKTFAQMHIEHNKRLAQQKNTKPCTAAPIPVTKTEIYNYYHASTLW